VWLIAVTSAGADVGEPRLAHPEERVAYLTTADERQLRSA